MKTDRYWLTDTWLHAVNIKLDRFNGLYAVIVTNVSEVLRKDAVSAMCCIAASPCVLLELPMFWTPGSGNLHFLGICPKQSYERELQTASDTAAIPACNIRRRVRCRRPLNHVVDTAIGIEH